MQVLPSSFSLKLFSIFPIVLMLCACGGEDGVITQTISTPQPIAGTGKINDTGITQCMYKEYHFTDCSSTDMGDLSGLNQDGEVGRDFLASKGQLQKIGSGDSGFDFTKISATGQKLPANASEWSCVKDNHTGLLWEVKTDDGGLHDKDNNFFWYNTDTSSNGGSEGYENGGKNTQTYTKTINQQALCGYNNWRLPSRQELHGIINIGNLVKYKPAIDPIYFPYISNGATGSQYWSSSPGVQPAGSDSGVFTVGLLGFQDSFFTKHANACILLVSSS